MRLFEQHYGAKSLCDPNARTLGQPYPVPNHNDYFGGLAGSTQNDTLMGHDT
jgi:hypothetical protein